MTYDAWKTESREDEQERLNAPAERRAMRLQWLEDHADYLNDMKRERRQEERHEMHQPDFDLY